MSDQGNFYDVFLCYKWEDGEAVEALRVALTSLGLKVFRDVIDGEVWAPLAESIRNALIRSRTLVALITPQFPMSPHCREELHFALCAAYDLDDGDTSRVMAVTQGVSPDDVRPRQLTRFRLPRRGTPPPELAVGIARVVARHDGVFGDAPTRPEPTWYPHERPSDRSFCGRYAELWELHEGLLARTKSRDRGHPVVSVCGRGGVGKTALVLAYARLFERDHPGGVFVLQLVGGSDGHADSTDDFVRTRYREQLTLIAKRLNVTGPDDVVAELERRDLEYLWIVDGVPATTSNELMPALYAPTRLGKTLITTRGRFAQFASLELEPCELSVLNRRIGVDGVLNAQPG